MGKQTKSVVFQLIPDSGDEQDNDWQEECRAFSKRLQRHLDSLDDTCELQSVSHIPVTADGENAKGMAVDIFSQLVVLLGESGITVQMIEIIFNSLNGWLASRKGSSATVLGADGSKYQFNNLSKDELLAIMRETRIENKKMTG